MPTQINDAIQWAYAKNPSDIQELVDKIREYFNDNQIDYETFSYQDLVPFLA